MLTRKEHVCSPVAPLMLEGPNSPSMLIPFIGPLFFWFSEHLPYTLGKRQARFQEGWFACFAFNRSMIQRFTGAIQVKEEFRALEMQIKIKLNHRRSNAPNLLSLSSFPLFLEGEESFFEEFSVSSSELLLL